MHTPTRRELLAAGGLALSALAGCTTNSGAETPTETGFGPLTGAAIATELTAPVAVEVPRSGEYYIVDQSGEVLFVDGAGSDPTTAVDLTDRMDDPGGEKGLLGMAVHPDYDGTGRAYLRYSGPLRSDAPSDYSHTFVLSEFEMSDRSIDPDSEQVLLEIPEPQSNHNAGDLVFGPEGSLYVAVGDGGAANDQGTGHVEDWYDAVGGGNGQDTTENLRGSILRIDVDTESENRPYGIPEDNPLVGAEGLDEHYAWGLRNPWRLSFGPDGRLFAADVGQDSYEEVNIVERGGNYGWNVREGAHCFTAEECPTTGPAGEELVDPIIEYPHEGDDIIGISVIGGYLYVGDDIPTLQGRYVFADYLANGQLFVATEGEDGWSMSTVDVDTIGSNVVSFGRTPAGELLVCSTDSPGLDGESGTVHRLESA
jgi:glucose/arabinose dehydrogenase